MEEIEILPKQNNEATTPTVTSPSGIEYSMSIRDYQNLSNSSLKINRKKTNRIMGNRKRSPSEIDRNLKRRKALEEIFDMISKEEEDNLSQADTTINKVCTYKGQDIPYKKRIRK